MELAVVLNEYESEFICDMAEFYHVFNYKELTPDYLSILLSGLRENSRVQMARAGLKVNLSHVFLATIADEIKIILRRLGVETEQSESLLQILINGKSEQNEQTMCLGFNSKDSFKEWWNSH